MEDERYKRGKIYRITDIGYNKCYIGSTIEPLSQRMTHHRCYFKFWLSGRDATKRCSVYDLFNEYGIENCKIELVELFPCKSKMELEAREGYYIRDSDCINKRIEGRTPQEYRKTHKDKMKEYNAIYQLTNKEQIYAQRKSYREENKDKIKEKKTCSFTCDCGSVSNANHKARHERTRKHLNFIEQQKSNE